MMPDININDSVTAGDLVTGIKTEKVNLQNIMNAEFKSDRKTCPYCEASGNHTFFACSTPKCSNRYCQYCPPNENDLCGTCQEFTQDVESWIEYSDSLRSEKDSLEEEKLSEIQKLSNSSIEMSMTNLEDRARFCHLSTNLQLVSFLTLILFSKIILNLAHGIEVITYSFFVMTIYNLIRRFFRDFPLSKTYILDIFGTMAILLISIILSNLISGTQAIIVAVLISGFFVVRMFNIGLILQSRTSGFSEFKTRLDYSAIGFTISCILCVLILYF